MLEGIRSALEALTDVQTNLPRVPIRTSRDVDAKVDEALRVLDALNSSGRLEYSDYCELHDVIEEISNG